MSRNAMASAAVIACLSLLGCQRDVFRFQIAFPEAPSLKEGAQVRYLGLEVGKVESIKLNQSSDGSTPEVKVEVALRDRNVRVRQDDKFAIATAGVLGEAYVEIQPGPQTARLIEPGSTVRGRAPAPPLKSLPAYLSGIGIGARLDSLPAGKREQLLKAFNEMIDVALEEERHGPGLRPGPIGPKK